MAAGVGDVGVDLEARARAGEVVRLGAGVARAVIREKVTRLVLLARQRRHDELGGHCSSEDIEEDWFEALVMGRSDSGCGENEIKNQAACSLPGSPWCFLGRRRGVFARVGRDRRGMD